MKILIINRQYNAGGGAEASVRGLVEMLKAQRHEVTVLALWSLPQNTPQREKMDVVYFHSLSNYLNRFRVLRFLADFIDFVTPLKIYKYIRKNKFDVIHTHNLRGMGMLTPFAIRAARRFAKLKWFHTLHDIQLAVPSGVKLYNAHGIRLSVAENVFAWMNSCVWGSPDCVFAPSQWLLGFYKNRGFFKNAELRCVPNIINPPTTTHAHTESVTGRSSILFVGVLEESKGIQQLIEAYLKLQTQLNLDVFGGGSLLERLKGEYKSAQIHFHGNKPFDEIVPFYRHALVTVIPSLTYENAPTVILESFRYGVPVIASKIGGIPEYVEEGITGWLVEPNSVNQLLQWLQLTTDRVVSDNMRKNCLRKSIELGVQAHVGYMKLYSSAP